MRKLAFGLFCVISSSVLFASEPVNFNPKTDMPLYAIGSGSKVTFTNPILLPKDKVKQDICQAKFQFQGVECELDVGIIRYNTDETELLTTVASVKENKAETDGGNIHFSENIALSYEISCGYENDSQEAASELLAEQFSASNLAEKCPIIADVEPTMPTIVDLSDLDETMQGSALGQGSAECSAVSASNRSPYNQEGVGTVTSGLYFPSGEFSVLR